MYSNFYNKNNVISFFKSILTNEFTSVIYIYILSLFICNKKNYWFI